MTDDALRVWLPIIFGSFLIGYAAVSVITGKFFEGWGWEMIGPPKWTLRSKHPRTFWFNIVLFTACGLFVLGLGVAKLLGFPLR